MLVVVHAAIEYFIKESPLEVKAEAGSQHGCSDKSCLITHTIIKNHRVGVCWFWRGSSTLIAHNCTGCHPRRTCSGAMSALWASFDSESGGKKICFDHKTSTVNADASPFWSEKAAMAAVAAPVSHAADITAATTNITTRTWGVKSCSRVRALCRQCADLSFRPSGCSHVFFSFFFCHPTLEVTK